MIGRGDESLREMFSGEDVNFEPRLVTLPSKAEPRAAERVNFYLPSSRQFNLNETTPFIR